MRARGRRSPGGAFGPPASVGRGDDVIGVVPAAAVRADGGAIVAWNDQLAPEMNSSAPVTVTWPSQTSSTVTSPTVEWVTIVIRHDATKNAEEIRT